MNETLLIGIDCAVQASKVGLAVGHTSDEGVRSLRLTKCNARNPPSTVALAALAETEAALLCLDAPLGWPQGLAPALDAHSAGQPIVGTANELFRRETDRFVYQELRKTPLDVGADRIARTAVAALELLGDLRDASARELPLSWTAADPTSQGAIEVYPAATLIAREIDAGGYKTSAGAAQRRAQILEQLGPVLQFASDTDRALAVKYVDCFDACLCALAGLDFLRGDCHAPPDRTVAEKEGWIWFPRKERVAP